MTTLGQFAQGLFKGGRGVEGYAAIFPAQKFLGVVALHDGYAPPPEIGQIPDILDV